MNAHVLLKDRFIRLSHPLEPIRTNTEPQLQELSDIQVVVYDFYGTLFISGVGDIGIDDGSSDSGLLLEALNSSGLETTSKEAGTRGYGMYNNVVAGEMKKLQQKGINYPEPDIRRVWKLVLDQMLAEGLIANPAKTENCELLSIEFETRMNPVWPTPGAAEILSYFKNRDKLQGILSNSQFYTPIALEALMNKSLEDLGFHPNLLHWSFEEEQKKPGISFYENFLKKLDKTSSSIQPEQVLYVGNDMLKDIYPANKVGMRTALFAGDKRSLKWRQDDSRCRNLKPDLVITELLQLKKCVQ
ncbi:MAG: HAD hydrolase-like protein [Balneolaceae bacterium]